MPHSLNNSSIHKTSLIIIGNGMATGRLLDEILKRDAKKYAITVIGEEAQGSYNRIMLSSVLAGDVEYDEIIQKPHQWYKDNNIRFISSAIVTSIQSTDKTITLQSTESTSTSDIPTTLPYEQLILATGSRSAKIPAKNQNISGIFNFRNINDTQKIQQYAVNAAGSNNNNALVVGGGLLGLEAAYGLALSGVKVTLIHRNKWLLNRQLDQVAGTLLQNIMAAKNINFVLGHEVARFEHQTDIKTHEKHICGAELTDGTYLKADMAVIATGISPNIDLANSANLAVNRAIIVDDYMQTSDANISALGECCEHNKATFGLVDPIWTQCETLAERLANNTLKPFENSPVPTKLKVSGVQLFSAGVVESSLETTTYDILDKNSAIYRKIILKNGVIIGVILFGDVSAGMAYFDLMQNKQDVSAQCPELLIGTEFLTAEAVA